MPVVDFSSTFLWNPSLLLNMMGVFGVCLFKLLLSFDIESQAGNALVHLLITCIHLLLSICVVLSIVFTFSQTLYLTFVYAPYINAHDIIFIYFSPPSSFSSIPCDVLLVHFFRKLIDILLSLVGMSHSPR